MAYIYKKYDGKGEGKGGEEGKGEGGEAGGESNLFFLLISSIGVFVQRMYMWDEKWVKYYTQQGQYLDMLGMGEGMGGEGGGGEDEEGGEGGGPMGGVEERYLVSVSVEALLGGVNSIEVFCDSLGKGDQGVARGMARLGWPSILPAFEMLLHKSRFFFFAFLNEYQIKLPHTNHSPPPSSFLFPPPLPQ